MRLTFHYRDSVDSTNNQIRQFMEKGCPEGTVLSTGEQTAGRGRSGHDWTSPPRVSIATSIALYPKNIETEKLPRLTILAGVSVAEAIETLYPNLSPEVKWPNDILLSEKKICGILTERISLEGGSRFGVIIGIGVNVHNRKFPEEIAGKATSIDLELEKAVGLVLRTSRRELTEKIWERFLAHYEMFSESQGSLSNILEYYNTRLLNQNRAVKVIYPHSELTGIAKGMDESGRLIVKTVDGNVYVDSGEVSVRGMNGYV